MTRKVRFKFLNPKDVVFNMFLLENTIYKNILRILIKLFPTSQTLFNHSKKKNFDRIKKNLIIRFNLIFYVFKEQ
jgi:hypothetical protein